jgi:Transaldolase/Fructose-6-phosphate aldolase
VISNASIISLYNLLLISLIYLAIDAFKPQDATTNPSLILAAANKPAYAHLIDAAVKAAKAKGGTIDEQANIALDRLVNHSSFIIISPFILYLACRIRKGNPGYHTWPRLYRSRRPPFLR